MCDALNAGIVDCLLPQTTNFSMHCTQTTPTNHLAPPRTAAPDRPPRETLRSHLAADKAAGAAAG